MRRVSTPLILLALVIVTQSNSHGRAASQVNQQEFLLLLNTRANDRGCVVDSVAPNSPCLAMRNAKGVIGSIEPGDTLVAVNGFRTTDQSSLLRAINTSHDGTMTLSVIDKNTGRVEYWQTSAAQNAAHRLDPAVKRCMTRINRVLADRGLHPSIVPNAPFDLDRFNLAVFDMMWTAVAVDLAAAVRAELGLPASPSFGYTLIQDRATGRHRVTFDARMPNQARAALERTFGLDSSQFVRVTFTQKTETYTLGRFKQRFRPAGQLDLGLVADGIRDQFQMPASVIRRSSVELRYTVGDQTAYATSPWYPVALGDDDRGVNRYHWALQSGVEKSAQGRDRWEVGSRVLIGWLPLGEHDAERMRKAKVADYNTQLAKQLRVAVTPLPANAAESRVVTIKQVDASDGQVISDLSANGNTINLLEYGNAVLDELRSILIGD